MTSNLFKPESKKEQFDRASQRITEMAAKKMYADLLLGDYNKNYQKRIEDLQSSQPSEKENLPPHAMDLILQPGKSIVPTSFDLIKRDVHHSKVQEQAIREEALFTICILKKHEFVRKWRKFKSFEKDDRKTVSIVKKVAGSDPAI